MKQKFNMLMTKQLANEIEQFYSKILVGKTFPVDIGQFTIQVTIDNIFSQRIEENAYDIILQSKMKGIALKELLIIRGLNKISLFDYLIITGENFPYERFGIGLCKLLPERDEDGVDLYL